MDSLGDTSYMLRRICPYQRIVSIRVERKVLVKEIVVVIEGVWCGWVLAFGFEEGLEELFAFGALKLWLFEFLALFTQDVCGEALHRVLT